MTGQTPEMAYTSALHSAGRAEFWFCDGAPFGTQGVWRAALSGSNITAATRLATVANVAALTRRADRLWLVTTAGALLALDPATAGQTPSVVFTLPSTTGVPAGLTTDGRELFIACKEAAGQAANVWVFDPLGPALRPVALTPTTTSRNLLGIRIDAVGRLRCSNELGLRFEVEPQTGAVLVINPGTPMPRWGVSGVTAVSAAHDPWTRTSVVSGTYLGFSPTSPRPYAFLGLYDEVAGAWSLVASATYDSGRVAEPVATAPFELFGRECANAVGSGARVSASGLPMRGGSFALQLRAAEPGATEVCWLGSSRTQWASVRALPFDLAPIGAAGCRVLAATDVVLTTEAGTDGRATLAIGLPMDSALAGVEASLKWGATTSANALGLATSDAVVIRIR